MRSRHAAAIGAFLLAMVAQHCRAHDTVPSGGVLDSAEVVARSRASIDSALGGETESALSVICFTRTTDSHGADAYLVLLAGLSFSGDTVVVAPAGGLVGVSASGEVGLALPVLQAGAFPARPRAAGAEPEDQSRAVDSAFAVTLARKRLEEVRVMTFPYRVACFQRLQDWFVVELQPDPPEGVAVIHGGGVVAVSKRGSAVILPYVE